MRNTKKLQIMSLIGGMTFYTPIFTLFLLQREVDLGFIVAAQTLFTVGMLASTIPTGLLADHWGQKRTIQIGMILDIVSMLSLIWLHTPAALLGFFIVRGIAIGFRDGADEALLYDSYVEEHGNSNGYSRAFGKLLSNDTLGFVIATAIAGLAVQFIGQASYIPMIIATAVATLVTLVLASTLRNCRPQKAHAARMQLHKQLKAGFGAIKKSHTITALALFGLLTINGEYFLRQTYQPYFEDMAVPAVFLGIALSAGKLLNFVAIRNVHRLEERFTVDRILQIINLILGVGFILLAFAGSAWAVVAAFMLVQALLNLSQPIISDYVNQQIDASNRSTVLSTVSFVQNIGQIVARVLLGISIGLIGLSNTFIGQGVYLIIGTIIGVWYIRSCGCVHKVSHSKEVIPTISA